MLRNVWFGFEKIEINLILLRRTDKVNKKNELIMGVDIKCDDESTSMSVNRLEGETTGYLLATLRAIRAKLVYISSSIHTCAAINAFVWYGKGKRSTLNCKTLGPYNAATFLTVGHACLQSGQVKSTKAER